MLKPAALAFALSLLTAPSSASPLTSRGSLGTLNYLVNSGSYIVDAQTDTWNITFVVQGTRPGDTPVGCVGPIINRASRTPAAAQEVVCNATKPVVVRFQVVQDENVATHAIFGVEGQELAQFDMPFQSTALWVDPDPKKPEQAGFTKVFVPPKGPLKSDPKIQLSTAPPAKAGGENGQLIDIGDEGGDGSDETDDSSLGGGEVDADGEDMGFDGGGMGSMARV